MNDETAVQGNKMRDKTQKTMPTCYSRHRFFVKMRFSLRCPIFCIPIEFWQCVGLVLSLAATAAS